MPATLFDPDDDSLCHARALGEAAGAACEANAVRQGWNAKQAEAFILAYLREHGATAGEVLVTEASRDNPPHDGRAFGPIFARLRKRGVIEVCGSVPRTKGRGTAGGLVWRLTESQT